eukprot:747394-Hanusia_phi.AAC.3
MDYSRSEAITTISLESHLVARLQDDTMDLRLRDRHELSQELTATKLLGIEGNTPRLLTSTIRHPSKNWNSKSPCKHHSGPAGRFPSMLDSHSDPLSYLQAIDQDPGISKTPLNSWHNNDKARRLRGLDLLIVWTGFSHPIDGKASGKEVESERDLNAK